MAGARQYFYLVAVMQCSNNFKRAPCGGRKRYKTFTKTTARSAESVGTSYSLGTNWHTGSSRRKVVFFEACDLALAPPFAN